MSDAGLRRMAATAARYTVGVESARVTAALADIDAVLAEHEDEAGEVEQR